MLILASGSAVRKALLLGAGLTFETRSAGVNERLIESQVLAEGGSPLDVARRLAEAKALATQGDTVIGADQILVLDGAILHKTDDGRARLDQLRGRTHQLHAGIALAKRGALAWSGVETATLTMRDFSDDERDEVVRLEGPDVVDSVGAYRLEGPSVRLFDKIEGDYFTILGLPLLPLLAALRHHAPEALQ